MLVPFPLLRSLLYVPFDVRAQEHAERIQYLGREGHTGRMTTVVCPELVGSPVLAEFVDFLRASDSDLPRWLEGMAKCRRG